MPRNQKGDEIIIPMHYVDELINSMHQHGVDSTTLLAEQNIDVSPSGQPAAFITPAQMSALILSSATALNDEMLGFFQQPTRRGFAVFLFRYMLGSDSLSEYLQRGAEFITQFLPPFDLRLRKQRDTATLELIEIFPDSDANHAGLELFLGLFMRMTNWAIDEKIRLYQADFAYARPVHHEYYALLFNGPSNFDQAVTRLVFPRQYLKKRIQRNKHDLNHLMKTFPLQAFLRPGELRSISDRVAGIVYDQLMDYQDLPTLTHIARTLGASEQTLRRQLQRENSNYQEIKDNVRGKIATHKLATSEDTITEIAFMVGFSDANNFTRAFKSWYKVIPSEYRKRHSAERAL